MKDMSATTQQQTGQATSSKKLLEPATRMKQLVEMSHSIMVDRNVAVNRYFNSGRELIRAAATFEADGEIERAFVLYLRYMTLFVEKLPHHPEYNKADKNEKKLVKDECNHVLELAESLKKRIMQKYELEYSKAEEGKSPQTAEIHEAVTTKRSIEPQGRWPTDCDVDEIDLKFDFSATNFDGRETTVNSQAFDPFNIEELRRSFGAT